MTLPFNPGEKPDDDVPEGPVSIDITGPVSVDPETGDVTIGMSATVSWGDQNSGDEGNEGDEGDRS